MSTSRVGGNDWANIPTGDFQIHTPTGPASKEGNSVLIEVPHKPRDPGVARALAKLEWDLRSKNAETTRELATQCFGGIDSNQEVKEPRRGRAYSLGSNPKVNDFFTDQKVLLAEIARAIETGDVVALRRISERYSSYPQE